MVYHVSRKGLNMNTEPEGITAEDVLNIVRAHRNHVSSFAATCEARADRYGDHAHWVRARELGARVRDLDLLIRTIERALEEART
jgi:hypothetical protein